MKVGIIGAGALGLSAAYELIKKGHSVVVFEKEAGVGGLAVDFEYQGWHLEKFYHHLFKTDTSITALIKEIGLGEKLVWIKPITATYYDGQVYPLGSAIDVLKFSPLSLIDRLRLGMCVAYLKFQPNYHVFDGVTAVYWLKKYMGHKVYSVVWEPLLRSKFGPDFDKIAMSWFWARIYYRTEYLGYLKGGFYQFYNRLAEVVKEKGGVVEHNSNIEYIESIDKPVVKVNGKEREFDKIIVTTPTSIFQKLAKDLPLEYIKKYPSAKYFAAQTVVLVLNKPLLDVYWLNINDKSLPFMAYVEHTNFMTSEEYGGKTLVYLGNYFSQTDPRFLEKEEQTLKSYIESLKVLSPDFDAKSVEKGWVFRTPFAQPIVGVDYAQSIPPFETPLKDVYLANMAQVYPQDRGQNYSVKLGKKVVEEVLV